MYVMLPMLQPYRIRTGSTRTLWTVGSVPINLPQPAVLKTTEAMIRYVDAHGKKLHPYFTHYT